MKKDIIWLILLAVGAALVYPDWIGLSYPKAFEWIGFTLLWTAIIWQAIDTIKEVAHGESEEVHSHHREYEETASQGELGSHPVYLGDSGGYRYGQVCDGLPLAYIPRTHKRRRR